ncbi:SDR family oxidoreductase [Deinococcus sonorensis]|uniref:SDR family oxidoreductase n=2 Tax=Deinococcus sonorensis TaxID=309891 RepID=A0AAU7U9N2_9DEIO
MNLSGKVVLITGASGGIGLAAARLFAAQGARVALAARSAERLQALAEELPGALAVPTDMLDDAAVRRMVTGTHRHYGQLDVLVNNAGRGMHVPVEQASLEDYRQLLDLNVVSVLNAMQAAIPLMRQQGGGAIVNVSSGTTKMLIPGLAPYSSSKHALNNLSLVARAELAPDGIVVSVVHPGMTDTDFGRNSVSATPERAGSYRQGDPPEYAAGLILEAVQTGAAEVYAASVQARLDRASV